MMSCLKNYCHSCCPCCCSPPKSTDKYVGIEYRAPEHANVAMTSPEIQKVPFEKVFEFQQPKPEYGIHPQMSGTTTPPVVSKQPRVAHGTSPDRELPESPNGRLIPPCPIIEFSLFYDMQRWTLSVHLLKMYNLPVKGLHCDPFAVMFLLPNREEIFESQIIPKTLNPVFDQTFQFTSLQPQEIRKQTLVIRIYDHDKGTKSDLIGIVNLPLEEADIFGMMVRKRISENVDHLRGETKGDLLFSLAYLPQREILQGIILKATNLQKSDVSGTADPSVKVYLIYEGKRQQKWKSAVKKHTLIPVFNEIFQFKVHNMELSDLSLEIFMMEHDSFSKSEVVGVVQVGLNADDKVGRLHWDEVITSAGKPVSRWHSIKPLAQDDYGSERSSSAS